MTPYRFPRFRCPGNRLLLLILVTAFVVNLSPAWAGPQKGDFDALTKSGWEHFYDLEYDLAIQDFKSALEVHPDDAAAVNHLLDAVLYRELYKFNALDTRLYARQGLIFSKQIAINGAAKEQLRTLSERALSLSDKRLKSDPNDVQALYNRGISEGLRSTYLAIVEHSWFGALRWALSARHDHEQVLKLRPDWADAKTIVGVHNFVVGSLTRPMKVMAGIAGIHGNKNKGLKLLAEAGAAGGETSTDARVALALFLRREGRFEQALDLVHALNEKHPRNFLFALENANLLAAAGKNVEAANSARELLRKCKQGRYPNPHLELAYFTLGEALRADGKLDQALQSFESAADSSTSPPDDRQRALLEAGEVSDLLAKRQQAMVQYRAAIALNEASEEAQTARKYLDKPYTGN
jgi:tetratricopeptide (TPR) repeat protein